MNRNELIAYALKYEGDYLKVLQAIKRKEKISPAYLDNCLTILDDDYPRAFLALAKPPIVLFYKGDLSLLKKPAVGIIGSRKPCDYALKATEILAKNTKEVIVSGMAKGIDACSHKYAKETIAILGSGIDYIYPYCNADLYRYLINKQLVMSEYPGKSIPYAYHFPFRNRLIAALADRLYVMQSSDSSGTLSTVNEMLELGKEVFVLPYDVFNTDGAYNNVLISEGAQIISFQN